jgi:hypothetical protein
LPAGLIVLRRSRIEKTIRQTTVRVWEWIFIATVSPSVWFITLSRSIGNLMNTDMIALVVSMAGVPGIRGQI